VSGVILAAASGLGFGLFQAVNVRAIRQLDDVYLSTSLQLVSASLVLVVLSAATGELGAIGDLTAWAIVSFTIAGAVHFFMGWTLLNVSQHRIGAARTAPLLATVPLWGIAIAAVVYGELPPAVAWIGIVTMVAGALTVSSPAAMAGMRWTDGRFGIATAFLWALSPIFTIEGLEEVDAPVLGVTIGMVSSALAFGLLTLLAPGDRAPARAMPRSGLALKMLAGALVALATWWRFESLVLSPVGIVLALTLLAVPTVLILAPLLGDRGTEQVTLRVWLGAALVIAGSLVLIAVEA
jgi:drug/metabolite transporter (DMT)-like permease